MLSQSHNTLTGRIRESESDRSRAKGTFELSRFIRQHGLDVPKELVIKLRIALDLDEQQQRDA